MNFKKAILFIVLLIAVLFGLEKLYDFLLLQNKNIKSSHVLNGEIEADLLICGPCEPLWMVDPNQLDRITNLNSYNLALRHSNFADNYLHLHLYLKNNPAPDYILLYVTPESMDERYNTFNTYRFAHLLEDPLVKSVVLDFDPGYMKWSKIPFMKYAYYNTFINFKAVQGFKHFITDKAQPKSPNGFQAPVVQDWHYQLDEFIDLYPQKVEFQWSKRRAKYLKKFMKLAKSKSIQLIFYESPVFHPDKIRQDNRDEIIDSLEMIAKQGNIPIWLFDQMEMSKDSANFFSTLNTSIQGSEIFVDTLGLYFKENAIFSLD